MQSSLYEQMGHTKQNLRGNFSFRLFHTRLPDMASEKFFFFFFNKLEVFKHENENKNYMLSLDISLSSTLLQF